MVFLRTWMTETLLETTNEKVEQIAQNELDKRPKSKGRGSLLRQVDEIPDNCGILLNLNIYLSTFVLYSVSV